jgi:hypothetical protein
MSALVVGLLAESVVNGLHDQEHHQHDREDHAQRLQNLVQRGASSGLDN